MAGQEIDTGMMQIRAAMLAALALLPFAGSARAQVVDGFYIGAGAGLNLMQGSAASVDALAGRSIGGGISASVPARLHWAPGPSATASAGFGFGNGVRLELEGDYLHDAQHGGGGQQTQFGAMANVLFDADLGLRWVVPYVGVGGGWQAQMLHGATVTVNGIDSGSAPTTVVSGKMAGGLAYQAIVGASFPVPDMPGLSVTAEYRFMDKAGSRSFAATGTTPGVSAGKPSNATHIHEADDASHSVLFGLRYVLDAPDDSPVGRPPLAAIPAPAPPSAPAARTYLVYFDWNRADLTPHARDVIAEAVRNSTKVAHTRIDVTGHADASGQPQGNQVLSRRRADAVAAELQRWGVKPGEIAIHAVGDTAPLAPNKPGAREPLNRVVEVVYR